MRQVMQIISILALVVTIIPSVLFLAGQAELSTVKLTMLIATISWFLVAPFAWQRGGQTPAQEGEPGRAAT